MIGKELKRARVQHKITQEELAHRARMDRSHISDIERGEKSPTMDTFLRLCSAIGVSPSSLVARIERKKAVSK